MKAEPHSANAEQESCPKGAIAVTEKNRTVTSAGKYTCPMHPEVISDKPGACPICGMALEPVVSSIAADDHTELDDLTRRFWIGTILTVPVLLLAMGGMVPGLKQIIGVLGDRGSQIGRASCRERV